MVHFASLLASLALLSSSALAAPIPDNSYDNSYGGGNYNAYSVSTSTMSMMAETTSTKMKDSTTTMMMESTTTMMMKEDTTTMKDKSTTTTTMMSEPPMYTTTSTMMMDTTTTKDDTSTQTTATSTYSTPSYGSGYNNWNPGYDSCVQQCMNSYGAAPSMYTPPPTTNTKNGGSGGGGNTLMVMVGSVPATKRFFPMAVNATVGDTVHFVWAGGPHTVTRSSALLPCNKTLDETNFFASGAQNASFQFDVQVNETGTIWYYCGVPGHCPAGMFGMINPPTNPGAATTVTNMVSQLIATNPDLSAQVMYTVNKTAGTPGETWGDHIDMATVPQEMQVAMVQSVLMTKLFYGLNPNAIDSPNGASNPDGSPLAMPMEITAITASGTVGGTTTTAAPGNAAGQPTTSSAAPSATKTGGAMSRGVASSAAVGLAVLVALLAL